MKIEGGKGVSASGGAKKGAGTAAPGFAPATDAPQKTSAASSVAPVSSLDMIMALQVDGDGSGGKRARQARRGRDALDALDKLMRGLTLGTAPGGLIREMQHLRRNAETTGEPGLDAILTEIDIRLEVELAKLEMSGAFA